MCLIRIPDVCLNPFLRSILEVLVSLERQLSAAVSTKHLSKLRKSILLLFFRVSSNSGFAVLSSTTCSGLQAAEPSVLSALSHLALLIDLQVYFWVTFSTVPIILAQATTAAALKTAIANRNPLLLQVCSE